jgi:hypothetical protein
MPWASLKSNATLIDLSQFCALYIDVRIEVKTQALQALTLLRSLVYDIYFMHDHAPWWTLFASIIQSCYSRPNPNVPPAEVNWPKPVILFSTVRRRFD